MADRGKPPAARRRGGKAAAPRRGGSLSPAGVAATARASVAGGGSSAASRAPTSSGLNASPPATNTHQPPPAATKSRGGRSRGRGSSKGVAAAARANGEKGQPPGPKRKRPPLDEQKRAARFLASPSKATEERIARAYAHRLYLIDRQAAACGHDSVPTSCDFHVLGSTGNVYTVTISRMPRCTCPDNARGNVCKHLLFVMLRVLKVPQDNPCIWQKALLADEVASLLLNNDSSAELAGLRASTGVLEQFQALSGASTSAVSGAAPPSTAPRELEGDCPICYEPLANDSGQPKEPVVSCKVCGNNVHRDCFQHWKSSKTAAGVTCIFCRAPWQDEETQPGVGGKLPVARNVFQARAAGYINLAEYSIDTRHANSSLQDLYPDTWQWIGAKRKGKRKLDRPHNCPRGHEVTWQCNLSKNIDHNCIHGLRDRLHRIKLTR
eukprot:SM000003S11015  [mRNA]  locus=s3:290395:294938:- [translate_table: standard]